MEIPDKFWKEYEEADCLDRREKIKVLIDNIDEIRKIDDDKIRRHVIEMTLIGYFDDIFDYMWSKKNGKI